MSAATLAVIREDIKWLKRGFWMLFAATIGIHFVDPTVHWWIFTFP